MAAATGISRRSLTDWEGGHDAPSSATLDVVAAALGFPREFFLGSDPEELLADAASFRALSRMTARERDRAVSAAELAFDLHDWIEERFTLPSCEVPDLRTLGPEDAAELLRARWGLGDRPIGNVIHLLEAKGVRVFSLAEDTANVDAFSLWRGATPFVFLNTRKSPERDRVDAAHELGHLILHRGPAPPHGRPTELAAEAFASAFLMPRTSVLAHVPRTPTLGQLVEPKQIWRVSVAALAYRVGSVGLVSEWRMRQLWIEIGKRGYRREEPLSMPRETSQLLAKVFAELRDEGVGLASVARELRLPRDELDALIFGLVPVALPGGQAGGATNRPPLTVVKGGRS